MCLLPKNSFVVGLVIRRNLLQRMSLLFFSCWSNKVLYIIGSASKPVGSNLYTSGLTTYSDFTPHLALKSPGRQYTMSLLQRSVSSSADTRLKLLES